LEGLETKPKNNIFIDTTTENEYKQKGYGAYWGSGFEAGLAGEKQATVETGNANEHYNMGAQTGYNMGYILGQAYRN
jgi:hypothetical protein